MGERIFILFYADMKLPSYLCPPDAFRNYTLRTLLSWKKDQHATELELALRELRLYCIEEIYLHTKYI